MANEFGARVLIESTNKEIADAIKGLDVILGRINKINATGASAVLPSQFAANNRDAAVALKEVKAAIDKIIASNATLSKSEKDAANSLLKLNQVERSNIQTKKARQREIDETIKRQQKEEAQLVKAQSLYSKVQAKVNSLTGTYNDLAVRKSLGLKLSTQEEARLVSLQKRLLLYQNALIQTDAGIKKFGRSVGNYSTSFNPLNNAIGQFARELPNAGISFQTFAVSLSNQFGQLIDAIGQTVEANKQLIAQGQPIKSVGAQILGSLFSVQTALFVGVALFTAYSEEIGNFVSNLFSGSKAIDAFKESQTQLAAINNEASKSVIDERIQLESWLKTAQDVNLSYRDREIAANNILKQYPYWFENLGKERIMNGQVAEAVKDVNAALLARAKSNAAVGKITENQALIIDLEEKRVTAIKRLDAAQKSYNNRLKVYEETKDPQVNTVLAQSEAELARAKDEVAKIDKQLIAQNEINNRLVGYAITQSKEAIGLDYQATDGKKKQTEALRDYLSTQYELNRLRLENEASIQERIFNDENQNLERRELAYREYHEIRRQLAEDALKEAQRINNLEANTEIEAIRKRVKDGEITERNGNAVIASIRKDNQNKNLISYENYAEALRQIDISMIDSMKGVADAINSQNVKTQISQTDLRITEDYVAQLQKLNKENAHYRDVEKAAKEYAIANRDISRANVQQEINDIKLELDSIKDVEDAVQRRILLSGQLAQKQKELANINKEEAEEQAAAMAKLQKATENYLNSFKTDAFSEFGFKALEQLTKIEDNGKSVFENLIAGANTMGEKFAVVFNSITEVAQEAYNFLNQQNNARFQAEYESLERQTQVRSAFAEGNAAQEAEVQRQYDEERRKIQIAELKAKKEQAIFNAVINTAQGVTAALPNFALAAIVGALGAAQIALISSQQIPAFKDGVRGFGGGMAIVGDGGRSEIVTTPSGDVWRTPATDTLVNLPKGSNVFKSDLDFIRNSGAMFGGMPHVRQGEGNNLNMAMLEQLLAGSATNIISFDGKGFTKKIHTGHSARQAMNNRITMTGRTYRN